MPPGYFFRALLLVGVLGFLSAAGLHAASAADLDPGLPSYRPLASVTGTIDCSGADTMQDVVESWASAFHRHHPGAAVTVDRSSKLTADGFERLLAGQADCVTYVREAFPAEIAAYRARFASDPVLVEVAGGSYATQGGTHAIAVYVNAANPLLQLTMAQLDAVFSAVRSRGAPQAITRWGQLGLTGDWAERPVHLYGMPRQRGTGNPPGVANFIQQRVLLGANFREDLREQTDKPGESALQAIVNRVAEDPSGIGYSGFAFAVAGVKTLALAEGDEGPFFSGTPDEVARRAYPLSRRIYLLMKPGVDGRLSALQREFLHFVLSREGQQTVASDRIHFLSLNAAQAAASGAALEVVVDLRLPHYRPQRFEIPTGASYITPDGEVSVIGYNDMQGMLTALNRIFVAAHPGIRFRLVLKGTRTAPPALAQGISAFAPMGAEFSPSELDSYRRATGTDPVPFRVAHASLDPRALSGPLAFFVHASNPLSSLTIAQAARIFAQGTSEPITAWGQLGVSGEWAARSVQPVGLAAETALALFLSTHKFAGRPYVAGFAGYPQSADVIRKVGDEPLAIGFAALNRATPAVKVLAVAEPPAMPPSVGTAADIVAGRYPLDRYLYIYVRRAPGQPVDPLVREYLRLVLSYEGQQAIAGEGLGYLPLNTTELASELKRLEQF